MFLQTVIDNTFLSWMAPLLPSQRAFYLYLLAAFVIAGASWLYFSHREESARPDGIEKGLIAWVFDPKIWFHRSARQDYLFFFLNALLYYGIIAQLMISGHMFFNGFSLVIEAAFGTRDTAIFQPSLFTAVAYTLAVVLAIDLGVWLTHYLQHKFVVLWQFHQVHHSAEVLTPMTVYRMHPVDLFFTGFAVSALVGLAFAGFSYLTNAEPRELTVMNLNVITFLFYILGYNLRHSHIWIGYPRWLSHILISPAMHQIHHSIDPKHWNKNMGLVFSVWDWAFGTLYVPQRYEKLQFGVSRAEPNPFNSVTEIYLKPFSMAWAELTKGTPQLARRVSLLVLIFAGSLGYVIVRDASVFAGNREVPSVYLEDLTWSEVDYAQSIGYDTVIIPTGGTEQNGPHVILGKHNYIVKETAGRIAERLGGALVAPVVAYVPEGETGDAPTGHMRFAGTISVPDEVFAAVLEHAARSMATHGFRRILFVGDSGGNQKMQERVAAELSDEWRDRGINVWHIGDYYSENHQVAVLAADGFTHGEIGAHAGIRDTSELIAVNSHGVRVYPLMPPEGAELGYSGAPSKASAEIGERMLDLKVRAALAQIERLSGPDS